MPEQAPERRRRRTAVNIALFVATLASTFWVSAEGRTLGEALGNGLVYMASLVGILLGHEMGHYVMARRNRIDASLPYFIPFPFLIIGTFGAVIVMRGRIRSRNALMEVGAAGPLAGLVVTIPVLLVGLRLSPVLPIPEGSLLEGSSLLYMALKRLAAGPIPPGHDVMLHPMAWAGWVGLLVTMLNLLPIGQLDGGHVFYALFGEAHRRVSRLVHVGLFALGLAIMGRGWLDATERHLTGDAFTAEVMTGTNWLFLGLMLLVVGLASKRGLRHPPTDDETLSTRHRAAGYACLAVFALTFMPVPLKFVV